MPSSSPSLSSSLSSSTPLMKVDMDRVLEAVGPFGRYQQTFYILLCLPTVVSAFLTMLNAFIAAVPQYRCYVPDCDARHNATYQAAFDHHFANFSLPFLAYPDGHLEVDRCHRFQEHANRTVGQCLASNYEPHQGQVVPCSRYVFDRSVFGPTVVTEFGLTCEHAWKVPLIQSLYFGGVLVATTLFGYLADTFGRKPILMLGIAVTCLGGVGIGYSSNYVVFMIFEVITAIGQVGLFQTAFILCVEFVGKDWRVLCGIVIEYFFVFGEVLLVWFSWYFRDWRKVVHYVTLPSLAFLLYWPVVPESVRWLISNRKYVEAQDEVDRIAIWNQRQCVLIDRYSEDSEDTLGTPKESFFDLLKRGRMVARALIIGFGWLVVSMTYYGLSLNAVSLAGDHYANFLLVSLVEIPGYTLSYITMTKLGRRLSVSVSLLVGGASCLATLFVPGAESRPDLQWLNIALFMTGKMGATCAFGTIYLYTSELYPTSVRTIGIGLSSMFARIGAIVSPYVAMLATVAPWLPMAVFGGCGVLSGLLTMFLPETLGKELPDSIDEALQFGRPAATAVAPFEPMPDSGDGDGDDDDAGLDEVGNDDDDDDEPSETPAESDDMEPLLA